MALMAILRSSSRSMASMLPFCTKKRTSNREAKIATMMISRTVKPVFDFIALIIT